MRVSIVCIAIFCLSHVSGAPTNEEVKTSIKSYNFDKGEVINSLFPFRKDEAVFAVCEGSDADKKCKVYVDSTKQDKSTLQSCDLNLTYSGRFVSSVALFNAGNSKAVFAVRDGETKIKLITVHLKGCQIKEISLEVAKENMPYIIPHEENYDVLFEDSNLCTGLCKATYDYEGNVVKAASKLPEIFEGFDEIEYANNTYIILKSEGDSANIYLVKDGENQENVSPAITIESVKFFTGLSADENKIALCTHGDGKVLCRQIHVDGEPRTINIEIPFNSQGTAFNYLDVLNLENGLLQVSVAAKNVINVTHFDEAGKQGKTVQVDPKCNENNALITKLYKNTEGEYCVNSFCMAAVDSSDRSKFSINNRCFLKSELI